MTNLVLEIGLYLGAAAVIGFLTGWFVQEPRRRRALAQSQEHSSLSDDFDEDEELSPQHESESNETIGRMASEIEQLRTLLESLSVGVAESATDENTDHQARERAEQTARELDHIQHKFTELASAHEKLQLNYDKVADRVVEFEKERLSGKKSSRTGSTVVKPVSDHEDETIEEPAETLSVELDLDASPEPAPKPIPSPVRKDTSDSPKKELLFDHLPRFDRGNEPVITGVVDLDDLEDFEDLERSKSLFIEKPASPEPELELEPKLELQEEPVAEAPEAEWDADVSANHGAVQPLSHVPEIPADVISRMEVLGVRTNLDFLRKCAPRGGVNLLSMSMGLDRESVTRWLSAADLLRLENIRKDDIPALVAAGVDSVQTLAISTPDEVVGQLKKHGSSKDVTPADAVAKWIHEAKGLTELSFS